MAKIEATKKGADEALFLNEHGNVAEATTENIFVVKDGKVFTPPVEAGILEGVTRNTIMKIWKVEEKDLVLSDLTNADEIFLTGTGVETVPVLEVNSSKISDGEGPITKQIREKFNKLKMECESL